MAVKRRDWLKRLGVMFQDKPCVWDKHFQFMISNACGRLYYILRVCKFYGYSKEDLMASHTGQKWSRFFYSSRDFFFKLRFFSSKGFPFKSRSFLLKMRCFNSSRNFFSCRGLSSGHFSIQGAMLPRIGRSTCCHFLAKIKVIRYHGGQYFSNVYSCFVRICFDSIH